MKGQLLILSGPSGVGKDTVLDAWAQRNPRVKRVVACTTREPRNGERDGIDYTFLTREEFEKRIEAGQFLEHKEVHGNLYGTPLECVDHLLQQGKIVLLKIDVQGALAVMAARSDAYSVFLMPPDLTELERRLRGRAQDSDEAILKRLKNAEGEMDLAKHYHMTVVNGDVEEAVAQLEALVAG